MPIFVDLRLPAAKQLASDGHPIFSAESSPSDCINIGIINLMPIKPDTEYDFLQLIVDDTRPIKPIFIETATHKSKHTSADHLNLFYTTFDKINPENLNGIIITGAPLEGVKFEDVNYWQEITQIFKTIRTQKIPSLFICWAAFAAMYYWHGIGWEILDRKISGVFPHRIVSPQSPLLKGIKSGFTIPHSRFATWNTAELHNNELFRIAAEGDEQGAYLIESLENDEFYISGHGEYSVMTLDNEYQRDTARGMNPHIPDNYYPDNNPTNTPTDSWHKTALQMMKNWIDLTEQNRNKK